MKLKSQRLLTKSTVFFCVVISLVKNGPIHPQQEGHLPQKKWPLIKLAISDKSTTLLLGWVPLVGPISLGRSFQACGMKACDGQSMGMVHPCGAMALPATLRAVSESSVGTELKWPFCDRCDRCGRSVSSYIFFSLLKKDKKNKGRRYWHLKLFLLFFKTRHWSWILRFC